MNETRLCTIERIEQFLSASAQIEFTAHGDDAQRYEHISLVLKRFDYPKRNKRERGILLRYRVYGDARYERLAGISVSHLYNLRKSTGYQALRVIFTKTHPVCNSIGVRKAPRPNGRAGFVRVDTVHQGDLDGIKGGYHITCVDAVSQWQIEACVQGISEAFLLPVLELIIEPFPFFILGFHSENEVSV